MRYRSPRQKHRYETRFTARQKRVLTVLLTGAENLGGYTICRLAGVGTVTTYLMFDRLEDLGWVRARWEVVPEGEDRPRRRFYTLTSLGRKRAREITGLAIPQRWDDYLDWLETTPLSGLPPGEDVSGHE